MDILSFLNTDNYQIYNRLVAQKIGVIPAILLSELVNRHQYHEARGELVDIKGKGSGWFYLTHEKCEERTAIQTKTQERHFKMLINNGLIEKTTHGLPGKRFFRLQVAKIEQLFPNSKNVSSSVKMTNLEQSNCPNWDTANPHPYPYIEEPYIEELKENIPSQTDFPPSAPKPAVSTESFLLSKFFFDSIVSWHGSLSKTTKPERWAEHFEKMLALDGRTPDEIRAVVDWLSKDDGKDAAFWRPNILSGKKLREKFDVLKARMGATVNPACLGASPDFMAFVVLSFSLWKRSAPKNTVFGIDNEKSIIYIGNRTERNREVEKLYFNSPKFNENVAREIITKNLKQWGII